MSIHPRELRNLFTLLSKWDDRLHVYLSESDPSDPLGGVIALSFEPLPEFDDEDTEDLARAEEFFVHEALLWELSKVATHTAF